LSHEAASLNGEYRNHVNAHKKRYVELCASIMAGLRPDDSPAEHRAAALSLFGMMNWIYTWYHPERDLPVDELAALMTRVFLGGYRENGARAEHTLSDEAVTAPSSWRRSSSFRRRAASAPGQDTTTHKTSRGLQPRSPS